MSSLSGRIADLIWKGLVVLVVFYLFLTMWGLMLWHFGDGFECIRDNGELWVTLDTEVSRTANYGLLYFLFCRWMMHLPKAPPPKEWYSYQW